MFRAAQVHSVEQSVTSFFSVSYHFFYTRVSCDKLTEIIISTVVSFFAELYFTLDNSYFIFIFHRFLVSHLKDYICLSHRQVHQFVHTCIVDSRDEFQVVTIYLCTFVLCRSDPVSITSLAVFLCNICKVSTAFDSVIDTVSQCLCLHCIFCIYLDLTEFHRVGSSSLSNYFERVDCIVGSVIVRTINSTNRSRVQTCNYV